MVIDNRSEKEYRITATIRQSGPVHVVTVPKAFMDAGYFKEGEVVLLKKYNPETEVLDDIDTVE